MGDKMKNASAKRLVVTVLIVALLLAAAPVSLLCIGFGLPSQFAASYYGALGGMVEKLDGAAGKKIVLVGTSSVAFGVDSALLEEQLALCGYDYTVCNFGLYGALGTKLMLDLSRDALGKGDIVILMPEPQEQTMSAYFSARETWRALDGSFGLLGRLDRDDLPAMVGNYAAFAAEKFAAYKAGEVIASGVYASSSFDANVDLKKYPRPRNIMPGGHDVNTTLSLTSVGDAAFFNLVNEYHATAVAAGASVYYAFCPINAAAFTGDPRPELNAFADRLAANLRMELVGDPTDAVMEPGWFYDTDFHLNEAGMTVNTVRMLDVIKTALGDPSPTDYPLPEMPPLTPVPPPEEETGDDSFADCFTYAEDGDGVRITGMTEKGRSLAKVVVPFSHNDKTVRSFDRAAFAGNTAIEEITLQSNVVSVADYSFEGCDNLRALILEHTSGAAIGNIGFHLLDGADKCTVYIPKGTRGSYMGEYVWSYYFTERRVAELS